MPYNVSNGAIAEVSVRYLVADQTCLNIGHFKMDSGTTDEDGKSTLVSFMSNFDAIAGGVSATLCAATTTQVTVSQIVAQWIYPQRWARLVFVPNSQFGTKASPTVPGNLDLVCYKKTDLPGKAGVGPLHLSGLPTTALDQESWSKQSQTDAGAYVQQWCINYVVNAGVTMRPIIYRRANPIGSPSITTWGTSAIPRTIRRRGLFLGI